MQTPAVTPGHYYMARLKVDHPERNHQNLYVIAVRLIEHHDDPDMWLVQAVFHPNEHHEVHASALTPESEKLRLSRLADEERRNARVVPDAVPETPSTRFPRIPRLDSTTTTIPPIERLIQHVREAIAEYDRSGDHTKHSGSDCIRCRLREALPENWRD